MMKLVLVFETFDDRLVRAHHVQQGGLEHRAGPVPKACR